MIDLNDSQLRALHRYIIETKFLDNSNDIAFSPLLSEVADTILDNIIENCKINNQSEYEKWLSWRIFNTNKLEWVLLKNKIKSDVYWNGLDFNKKFTHLKILASPFKVTEESFLLFLKEIE